MKRRLLLLLLLTWIAVMGLAGCMRTGKGAEESRESRQETLQGPEQKQEAEQKSEQKQEQERQEAVQEMTQETAREQVKLGIQVGDVVMTAVFEENSSADALRGELEKGNITISMEDYANFEKVGALGMTLPRNDTQITTKPGDVILYLGNQLTIYYDTNSWNFTKIAHIEDVSQEELKEILGDADVTVTLMLLDKGDGITAQGTASLSTLRHICRVNGSEHGQMVFFYENNVLKKMEYSLNIKGMPEEIEERKRLEDYSGVEMADQESYVVIEIDAEAGGIRYLKETVPFFAEVENWSWENVKKELEKNGYQILDSFDDAVSDVGKIARE